MRRFIQSIINSFSVKLIVYDPEKEVIVKWQNETSIELTLKT
jgi:hypothetical protein